MLSLPSMCAVSLFMHSSVVLLRMGGDFFLWIHISRMFEPHTSRIDNVCLQYSISRFPLPSLARSGKIQTPSNAANHPEAISYHGFP
ncbi:hypothetical protein BX666DRAFT_2009465 [Dichotomocladium elegans]|nr:hypothetical protein BX666DRAFT_2009465 [Dichotomocladium elegans]